MAFKFLKHTWQRKMLIVLSGLVLLFIVCFFAITLFGPGIIKREANKAITKGTDSLYRIEFDDASINLLKGQITLSNLKLIADTNLFKEKQKNKKSPGTLFSLQVNKMVLSHTHPFKLWLQKKLDIGLIQVDLPDIRMAAYSNPEKGKKKKDNQTIYQKISKTFKEVRVEKIAIRNAQLHYIDFKTIKPAKSSFKELDINVHDLLIDSASQFDDKRFLFCRKVELKLHNYNGRSAKGLYAYKAKLVQFSTTSKLLQVDGLSLSPLLNPQKFFSNTHSDRFSIWTKTIKFHNFDWDAYSKTQLIQASKVSLLGGYIGVFSNPRFNPEGINKDKASTFPNQILRTLPVRIKADTVLINRYAINYREYNTKNKRTGVLDFSEVNSRMANVTNDSSALAKQKWCYVKLNARFMKKADLHVAFAFNLRDSLYSYSYQGSLSTMNMSAFNAATVPLASVSIKSGRLNKLAFDINANKIASKGRVTLLYNDLKVELQKADTIEGKMKKRPLISLAVNSFFLKNNNPDNQNAPPRIGNVNYVRPKDYPFFKTIWRTLLMGIKPCVGFNMNNKPDADVKKAKKDKQKAIKKHQQGKAK
ncbi:hypothetical protein KHS38_01140 [Mucilaginibacter sp. Bleaf8]|uniref:hypothetical protein n=1 Tax=Mucilaginibacter sp. Bleaf8 TaxID=2834430 RepID=UPI001BCBFAD3|nr:hypothetical protein [Mucilaginibacter sp. Bleaf8]MBS7562994.1 hypothetical protein [Mucilaginibacter sp. Bleaf8]